MAGSTVDWLEAVLGNVEDGRSRRPVRADDDAVATRTARVVHGRRPRRRRALARADDRAHGLHARRPPLRRGHEAELEGRPGRRASHDSASRDLAFIVSTSGVGGSRKDVAHTHGSIFATRVQAEHWLDVGRGDAVWCTSESTSPLTMWNIGDRAVVARCRGRPSAGRVRRGRTARPAVQARPEHPLPVTGRVPGARRAPEARALPLSAPPAPRLDRRLPRPRGRRGLRGALGHVDRRRLRPGRDEHRRRESRRRRREARLMSAAPFPVITSRSSTTRATSFPRASRVTSPFAAGPRRCSPATGSFRRRRSPRSSATGT